MDSLRLSALHRALFCVFALGCFLQTQAQINEQFFGTGFPVFSQNLADGNLHHIAYKDAQLTSFITDENGKLIAQLGELDRLPDDLPQINTTADGSLVILAEQALSLIHISEPTRPY